MWFSAEKIRYIMSGMRFEPMRLEDYFMREIIYAALEGHNCVEIDLPMMNEARKEDIFNSFKDYGFLVDIAYTSENKYFVSWIEDPLSE